MTAPSVPLVDMAKALPIIYDATVLLIVPQLGLIKTQLLPNPGLMLGLHLVQPFNGVLALLSVNYFMVIAAKQDEVGVAVAPFHRHCRIRARPIIALGDDMALLANQRRIVGLSLVLIQVRPTIRLRAPTRSSYPTTFFGSLRTSTRLTQCVAMQP